MAEFKAVSEKKVHQFTAPDGTKLFRVSSKRYTHAILCLSDGKWRLDSCCGRYDLVHSRLAQFGCGDPNVVVVEVDG